MARSITLTRQELYDAVWAEPIVHLVKRLGTSDYYLRADCFHHNIPLPTAGYWNMAAERRAKMKMALPPNSDSSLDMVTLSTSDQAPESAMSPEFLRERDPAWRIEVPDDLRITHPLLKAASHELRDAVKRQRSSPFRVQYKHPQTGPGQVGITVSEGMIPRSLRVMQALLTSFSRRGYATQTASSGLTVTILGTAFELSVFERYRQQRQKSKYGGDSIDLLPTGNLRIRVGGRYDSAGCDDNAKGAIESKLNEFVAGLVRCALEAKVELIREQEQQQRWRVREELERQEQQGRDTEKLRQQHVFDLAVKWSEHERLRQFIDAVEHRAARGELTPQQQEQAAKWIAWSRSYCDSTDPVVAFLVKEWPEAALRPSKKMPWGWGG